MHFLDFEQNWIKVSTQSSSSTSDPSTRLHASIDQAVLQGLWNCNVCFEKAWGSKASDILFLINKLFLAPKHKLFFFCTTHGLDLLIENYN